MLGAMICLGVAFLLWRRGKPAPVRALLIAALGTSAVHLLASTPDAVDTRALWLVAALRNLVWLAVLRALFALDGRDTTLRPVRPVILALALAELLQVPLVLLAEVFPAPEAFALIAKVSAIFHMLFAIGVLVLVHNLYVGAASQQRPRMGRLAGAFVIGWGCELNAFAVLYLSGATPDLMAIARAAAWSAAAVLILFDARRTKLRQISPSRSVAFQSLSLIVIALYLFALFTIDAVFVGSDAGLGTLSRFGAVVLAVSIGAMLASSGLRGWFREILLRNLFRHRYDYRDEWLRLSGTLAGHKAEMQPLEERAVQALADIVDSPAGLMLAPSEEGGMTLTARWNWPTIEVPGTSLSDRAMIAIERDNRVIDIDAIRDAGGQGKDGLPLPGWLMDIERAWALVPLQVGGRLAAVVVLARPACSRQLDWEDFDLLRIVGQQLAAHLGENQAHKALMEAARFDEFNRRIAFVMHDIKNLASQLGLLVSNAERHIENPAFRSDMLVTLRNATGRLESLLGRLSNYGGSGVGRTISISAGDAVRAALPMEVEAGLVTIEDDREAKLSGDPEALAQVLRHLVRNAIDASETGQAVHIRFPGTERLAGIEITDKGRGMSPEFIRTSLFKPFVTTKPDGFGIGAFEARELVRAMGGRLEVESREGLGSRFVIWLPRAEDNAPIPAAQDDRKVA